MALRKSNIYSTHIPGEQCLRTQTGVATTESILSMQNRLCSKQLNEGETWSYTHVFEIPARQ
jgi:hypothetical protein